MSSADQDKERTPIIILLLWSGLILLSAGLLLYLAVTGGSVGTGFPIRPRPALTPASGGDNQIEDAAEDVRPAGPEGSSSGGGTESGGWALWISALTLITSTVGLVSNAWLGWRKELRAARRDRLEAQQLRAELEKTLLEVQQLRDQLAGDGQNPV